MDASGAGWDPRRSIHSGGCCRVKVMQWNQKPLGYVVGYVGKNVRERIRGVASLTCSFFLPLFLLQSTLTIFRSCGPLAKGALER